MTLFDDFKSNMPGNLEISEDVAKYAVQDRDADYIKRNFSDILMQMQDGIYEKYLQKQYEAGQLVINGRIKTGSIDFNELDKLFLSISQSRKSRAGKAFEFTIQVLLESLSYPFSDQVVIEGAKPDYVMPSEEYFRKQPLDSIVFTAKRTLRERWRQVVTEANKGYGYFLATIDENISSNQIQQAETHKIYIVVPKSLKETISAYKDTYSVISFEQFFEHHLDPAMKRWGLSVKQEKTPDSDSGQQKLDI